MNFNFTTVVRVSKAQMQELFRSHKLTERKEKGEFVEQLKKQRHANPERSGQPLCTYSQMIWYVDQDDVQVALLHQYLRPDNKIGGSGLPDPVRLFLDGVAYKLKPVRES